MTIAHKNRFSARFITAVVGVLALGNLLTACGGASADGEYVSGDDIELTVLKIDGSAVTWSIEECGDATDERTGELNSDNTAIVWTDGGSGSVTVTDNSIGINGTSFVRTDSDDGSAVRDSVDDSCAAAEAEAAAEAAADAAAADIVDGVYITQSIATYGRTTFEDSTVTHERVQCDGAVEEDDVFTGVLSEPLQNEQGREVTWNGDAPLGMTRTFIARVEDGHVWTNFGLNFPAYPDGSAEAENAIKESCKY